MMGRIYKLKNVQTLPSELEHVWKFFSNPHNLLKITPPFLNLKVTNKLEGDEVYHGQVITYTVKPLLGIPLSWTTEITRVEPYVLFVDEQKKGPYRIWHHQHHFRKIDGGVEMTDLVHYQLPMGSLGSIAHALTVKGKLKQIFTYRYFKINEMFGDWPGSEMNLVIE